METNPSYNMCRLCLFRNNNLIDIFEVNAVHGFVVAEVIADLLSLQVSKDDGYPRVVCERCLEKLNEFKVFKEVCYTLKTTYDNLFFNRRASLQNQVVTMEVPVKLEPLEEASNEPMNFHPEVFPSTEVISGDCGSELPENIVKVEPVEQIDIEESKPEDLFHLSRDEISNPVRENVIFHSQMEVTPLRSEPSSENDFDTNEGDGEHYLDKTQKRIGSLTYMRSKKGKMLLVHDGYTFHHERQYRNITYWKCSNYFLMRCTGRVSVTDGTVMRSTSHNHPPVLNMVNGIIQTNQRRLL